MSHLEQNGEAVPVHPLKVKPLGNAYSSTYNLKSASGVLACLPDEIIIAILELLDPRALLHFGSTCKAAFAFASFDDLWKPFYLGLPSHSSEWRGSWRSSFLKRPTVLIECHGMFSDVLYRPFYCAKLDLAHLCDKNSIRSPIAQVHNLDEQMFAEEWCQRPFVLNGAVQEWPIHEQWDISSLQNEYGEVVFRAEAVDWPLNTYIEYMRNNNDESPLYLFDRSFREKMSLSSDAYTRPACFGLDLFDALEGDRPDFAWLIVGPEHSGSTFHKDPNATSAWNAVIRGSKYWIMFPPDIMPPGVFVSEDQSEVTSPLSIGEWLSGFLGEARKIPECIEGVCGEGQLLHVPSGWWHLVVNLEDTIAVTQNFVPPVHLDRVLNFLEYKSVQVSGFAKHINSPHKLFRSKLATRYPDILKGAKSNDIPAREYPDTKKRRWEDFVLGQDPVQKQTERGFNFAFEDESDKNG